MTLTPARARVAGATAPATPAAPSRGRLHPLDIRAVGLTDGLLARRQRANHDGTLPHVRHWLEREGWLANFDRVAHATTGPDRPGLCFSDSEVYKFLEALAWESWRTGEAWLEETWHAVVARVASAQDQDGYLSTAFGHGEQPARWSDLPLGHELYVVGHLIQAAVARLRTAGRDELVEVAVRAADNVCEVFGDTGRDDICGHPEIEVALVELGRALDEPRYVHQARLFVERRGHGRLGDQPFGREYFQDDVPVASAEVLRGHAVRALYLTAAAVDLAVDAGDDELLDTLAAQWRRTLARRTHLTGGMGSRHQDEGFGEDWELPPDRAYCETCAGIGAVMVAWRLLLATGDEGYADQVERFLLNVVSTSPADDGRSFFYANPLHQRVEGDPVVPDAANSRAESSERAPWFEVSCCPTNLARTFASVGAYVATVDDGGLQLHQYAAGTVVARLPGAGEVRLRVETSYPAGETVDITVETAPEGPWTLGLRVPAWCGTARVECPAGQRAVAPGRTEVDGPRTAGETVRLVLPRPVRTTLPDPRIDALRGCAAVEQGPDVLCLEGRDLPEGWALEDVCLVDVEDRGGSPWALLKRRTTADSPWPYRAGRAVVEESDVRAVVLRRYRDWGRRGPTTMRVWVPVA